MINPTKLDIGRKVIYKKGTTMEEEGYINTYNTSFVFVVYTEKEVAQSKATKREDLEWK